MYQYRIVKIGVKDKEEDINNKLNELGKEGWELVNFQTSSESPGLLKNNEPWTTFYILIFKK
jgi:hypothetical protein